MVRPAQRRVVVAWAQASYRVLQCRACRVLVVNRSTIRYRSVKPDQEPLRRRLREMAAARTHADYRQLHVYLSREGWRVNHKRLYRLYTEEGLGLRRKQPRRRRGTARRVEQPRPQRANDTRTMDFMHDTLGDGGRLRALTVVDAYTRECVALEVAKSFRGADIATILTTAATEYGGLPQRIRVDNGTEFTSKTSTRGPTGIASSSSSRGRANPSITPSPSPSTPLADESAFQNTGFGGLHDAEDIVGRWRNEYNNVRPHSSLGLKTPAQYRTGLTEATDRDDARKVAELLG